MNILNLNTRKYDFMISDDNDKAFAAALAHFLKNKPKKHLTQKEVAELAGVRQPFISSLQKGKVTARESTKRKIAAVYGYDGCSYGKMYDDFLMVGKRLLVTCSPQEVRDYNSKKYNNITTINAHKGIIEAFKDPDKAFEINQKLVEIEQADPDEYERVREYIELVFNRIARKKIADEDSG